MMQTDVKASTLANTGSIGIATRLKGLVISYTAGTGSVVLKDGGSGGTAKITINTPAVAEIFNVLIPGEGVRFTTDVYVDVTNVSGVTVFYG